MDERCFACIVKGGEESKCVSKGWEETIGKPLGRVCPRVDLDATLSPDAEILEFALSERLRPMAGLRAEAVAEVYGLTVEELNDTLSRVAATLGHPDIAALLNPPMEVPHD